MGLRGMRVRKSPLVRVLYAEATRPFPVNAKGAGPQTIAWPRRAESALPAPPPVAIVMCTCK